MPFFPDVRSVDLRFHPSVARLNASQGPAGAQEARPLIKDHLSRELQLYFDRLTSAVTDPNDETVRKAALASLRTDTGLSGLVPYLIRWISERVSTRLSDLAALDQLLDLLHAIVDNPTLYIEPYVSNALMTAM
jgi:transcription initiation factor TFIID subunit 6